MDIVKKHIARRKRMEKAESEKFAAMREIESAYNKQTAEDRKADKELLKKCFEAYCKQIDDEHECKCCNPNYPPSYDCHLDDEGNFHAFYDADHPNDRSYAEIPIVELLGVKA